VPVITFFYFILRWVAPVVRGASINDSDRYQAQRDVGLRVPLNFLTQPAVSLQKACFIDNQYEHHAFQKCISNLLGIGFTRFEVDIYWDPLQWVWSLCPVEQPSLDANTDGTISVATGPTIAVSTETERAMVPETTATPPGSVKLKPRQDREESNKPTISTSQMESDTITVSSSASVSVAPTITTFPTTDGLPLMQIGQYNCTSQMTLGLLTGIMQDFLTTTSTTTGAVLTFLNINIHAASSLSDPNNPAPRLSQSQLPQNGNLLSDVVKGNLSDILYTPGRLQNQRSNLNSSWYNVDRDNIPARGYYETSKDASGNIFTQNGWPTEALVEFQELYRLIASIGTIDAQMDAYNFGTDLDTIFSPGTISEYRDVSFTSSGELSSGCFYTSSGENVTSGTNSSFAIATPPSLDISANPDLLSPLSSVENLISCGVSPLLNESLAGTTADKNPLPYAAYIHSTLWSWTPGQPLNVTSDSSTANRCAVMTSSPHAGRWSVVDCAEKHYVACHDPQQPYHWEISAETSEYSDAESRCQDNLKFSVPHTALENRYLLAAMQTRFKTADESIYLDLNSLGTADCWVIGLNGTCPYLQSTDTNRTRIVVVPTVAAVIIFVLAAFTFFVKCASNRREDKRGRGRKLVGGWEYEGIPS
jgi:hypothetical protein